jgi:thioredoxin-related protein
MNVAAVPSTVFLDESGNPITILQGELSAKELEPYLEFISKDLFKKIVPENSGKIIRKNLNLK